MNNVKIISTFGLIVTALFLMSWTIEFKNTESISEEICFERDVLPVFINNCALSGCHDSQTRKHGFTFDSYDNILASKKGRAIIPFNLKRSKVYKKITEDSEEDRMPPPPHPPLSGSEITTIRNWIMSGALNTKCSDESKRIDDTLKSGNVGELVLSDIECDTTNVTYKDVLPVIEKNCYKCHSGNAAGELFNLDSYSDLKSKGEEGKLFGAVNHLPGFKKMPLKAAKLQGCDLGKINAWITQGMQE